MVVSPEKEARGKNIKLKNHFCSHHRQWKSPKRWGEPQAGEKRRKRRHVDSIEASEFEDQGKKVRQGKKSCASAYHDPGAPLNTQREPSGAPVRGETLAPTDLWGWEEKGDRKKKENLLALLSRKRDDSPRSGGKENERNANTWKSGKTGGEGGGPGGVAFPLNKIHAKRYSPEKEKVPVRTKYPCFKGGIKKGGKAEWEKECAFHPRLRRKGQQRRTTKK